MPATALKSFPTGSLAARAVLVLEDEALVALDLRFMLEDRGAVVHYAATCDEAVALVERVRLDGAILDVNLGSETCERAAHRLAGEGVPFLLYTGDPRRTGELVEDLGAPIVTKPADEAALAATLAALIDARS